MSRRKPTPQEWYERKCKKCVHYCPGNIAVEGFDESPGIKTPEFCDTQEMKLGRVWCRNFKENRTVGEDGWFKFPGKPKK